MVNNNQLPKTEEELAFDEWRTHPHTQLFIHHFLSRCAQAIKDQWAKGQFVGESLEATAVANLQALAQVQVYEDLSEIDFEKFNEVMRNE